MTQTMKYPYQDPKDFGGFKVIKEGEGKFKILDIKHGYSKKGQEQFVWTFKLQDSEGKQTLYMMYMQINEYMAENIYRICEAVGRPDLYSSSGETDPVALKGLVGKCKIKTEVSEEPTKWDDRSIIHRFIPYKPMLESTTPASVAEEHLQDEPTPF